MCRGFINDKVIQISIPFKKHNNKQLLDEVFVICKIINVSVRVISRAAGEADNSYGDIHLIILHITKTESNNCFITHFKRKKKQKPNPIIVLL